MAFSFDASTIQDELIPIGSYNFIVSKAEERETKNGHEMLSFEFTICDGKFEGKKIFENFLVGHPNCAKYAKISMSYLSKACKHPKFDDVSELHGKFLSAELVHREDGKGTLKEKLFKFEPYVIMNKLSTEINDIPF